MASTSDVRDIMGLDPGSGSGAGPLTKEKILASFDKTGQKRRNLQMAQQRKEAPKRPEGMAR